MPDLDHRPSAEQLVAAPKVLLHDHLDGGLRPGTIVECAAELGYRDLPATEPDELGRWFAKARDSGSLASYLAGFVHAYGVLQTRAALARAARENVEDLAADGVVYAETRFAPELHGRHGLDYADAVDAVVAGTREGIQQAAANGRQIDVRVIISAMRDLPNVAAVAETFRHKRDPQVVAFDLAGPEAGHPANRFRGVFRELLDAGVRLTVHAGEGDGIESIRQAALDCGAQRLGHGARIVEDVTGDTLGPVADFVHRKGLVLELCPSSNVHTGAAGSFAEHPALRLLRLGFAVTVNTDNRTFSQTRLSQEFAELVTHQSLTWTDVREMTLTAAGAAFVPEDEREDLSGRIASWYAAG